MSGSRPGDPMSAQSERWLRQVRANVKAQLFGPPPKAETPPPSAEPTEPAGTTSAPETDASGEPTRIGRFVVIKRIGEGGMGMVYAAYDDALDRKVAVKLLHPRGSGSNSDARARLIREAQALAQLSHPSVIHVYEVGTWQDQVYVAMEFVDGTTLERWQQQEGRTWRDVLEAYVAAGRGLAAAHAAGIIHRDFKAANVLVRTDGAVRVVDFGLARQQLEASAATSSARPADLPPSNTNLALVTHNESASDLPLTRTGVIMGTPAYMAPEQHLGQRAEPRCDQFSYCVSLYEALYGFRPFAGQTMGVLRRNVLSGRLEQPPRYTDIPPRIFRVLERGLQVHAGDRYPAMAGLLDDLTRDPRVALRRVLYGLGVLALFGLVAALWWSEQEQRSARAEGERLRAQFEHARVQHAEDELRRAQSRTVSEKWDDLVLAFARETIDDDPSRALGALKHLSAENSGWLPAARTIAADALQRGAIHRRLDPSLGKIIAVEFTEPGNTLVVAGDTVVLIDPKTARSEALAAPAAPLRAIDVTADAQHIAAIGRDNVLYVWTHLADKPDPPLRTISSRDGGLTAVAISDDGQQIAVGASDGTVRLLDGSGQTKRTLHDHKYAIRSLAFSPDSRMLASASDDGIIRQWFLGRGTHWTFEQTYNIREVRFSGDSEVLWSTSDDGKVRRWSTNKGRRLHDHDEENVRHLAQNPSNDRTLVSRGDGTLVLHRDGDPQPLLGLDALVTSVSMSHDGLWAAASTADEHVQWWRLTGMGGDDSEPDGSRIASSRMVVTALAFSEAGSLLASASRQGVVELWSEDGESRGQLGHHGRTIFDLGFSPQGHELAAHDEQGGLVVWSVADPETDRIVLRNEGVRHPLGWAWAPDGEAIAASQCDGPDRCDVLLYPLTGDPESLGTADSPATTLRFSRSGRFLLSDHPTGAWLWDRYEGTGHALQWPTEQSPGKRVAFAYVPGGLRIATAEEFRDGEAQLVSTTLRVWHVGPNGSDIHLLFEEPDLRTLLVDAQRQTLLLQTDDNNTMVWPLGDDRFRLVPSLERDFDGLVVAPDGGALLLRAHGEFGHELDSTWLDIDSGQMRRFSRRHTPIAWSAGGTVADAPGRRGLRLWSDPTPDQPRQFLRWLDTATNVRVASNEIR